MSEAEPARKPVTPLTKRQKRDATIMLVILTVVVGSIATLLIGSPHWDHGKFPRELAESTPHSVLQTDRSNPGTWEYLDDDLVHRPLGECVRIDGWRLQRPWQCTSADGTHVFTFRHPSGRTSGGFQDETLTVRGEDVPIDCTRTGEWRSPRYCLPRSASPTPEG